MTPKELLVQFCNDRLVMLTAEQKAAFDSDAASKPLQDFNVGQTFTLDGIHYAVPNPPTSTHAEFHDLRQKWQEAESA